MNSERQRVMAVAQDNGWELERSGAEFMTWIRRVPMIDRRDENRLHLFLSPGGDRVTDAYYGPEDRRRTVASSTAGIFEHLVTFGRPS